MLRVQFDDVLFQGFDGLVVFFASSVQAIDLNDEFF